MTGPLVLDAGAMAELRALDPEGRAQLVQRVLATYQGSLGKLLAQFEQARAADAWDQLSRVAHTLKSSSHSVGATAFSVLCGDIERLIREGETAAAGPLLDRFLVEAARVDAAVGRALQGPGAAGT